MLDFWIKEVDSWYCTSESRKDLEDLVSSVLLNTQLFNDAAHIRLLHPACFLWLFFKLKYSTIFVFS